MLLVRIWKRQSLIKEKKQSVPLEIMDKYVGEQDASELEECLLNPETRNIVQISVNDLKKTNMMFEILMGPSVPPRREYILKHSEDANE